MARFAALFALLVPLAAGGCLAPYCYPKLEHIPSIREESEADVHVFRVDVTRYPVKFLLFLTQTQQDQLRELSADDNHAVPAQTQLSMSRGLGLIGVLLRDDGTHVRHDLRLKLYRPGYELIVLEPGQPTEHFDWKPLTDLTAQSDQLDALCKRAKPGSAAPAHRDSLMFIAGEYERLAAKANGEQPALAQHLGEKAKVLRELAGL